MVATVVAASEGELDRVLHRVSGVVLKHVRGGDHVARWSDTQLVILLSAAQTIIQINIDQGKGLVRIGPERTRVWRVGGFPRRYDSSRVSISTDAEKGHVLVDDRPLGRLDLFDIKGAIELR